MFRCCLGRGVIRLIGGHEDETATWKPMFKVLCLELGSLSASRPKFCISRREARTTCLDGTSLDNSREAHYNGVEGRTLKL